MSLNNQNFLFHTPSPTPTLTLLHTPSPTKTYTLSINLHTPCVQRHAQGKVKPFSTSYPQRYYSKLNSPPSPTKIYSGAYSPRTLSHQILAKGLMSGGGESESEIFMEAGTAECLASVPGLGGRGNVRRGGGEAVDPASERPVGAWTNTTRMDQAVHTLVGQLSWSVCRVNILLTTWLILHWISLKTEWNHRN